jgi:hypothetical protein
MSNTSAAEILANASPELIAKADASWQLVKPALEALPKQLDDSEVAALLNTVGRCYGFEGERLATLHVRNGLSALSAEIGIPAAREAYVQILGNHLGKLVVNMIGDDGEDLGDAIETILVDDALTDDAEEQLDEVEKAMKAAIDMLPGDMTGERLAQFVAATLDNFGVPALAAGAILATAHSALVALNASEADAA